MTSPRRRPPAAPDAEAAGAPPAAPTGPATPSLLIVNVPASRRYEARLGDQVAGFVQYGRVASRLVALHTEVAPEFGGQGIGTRLVRHVIDDARANGMTITPRCPLFRAHFDRHPEDADLLAGATTSER